MDRGAWQDCSPQGLKEWVQFSSVQLLSRAQLFATPWTVARQAPLSMRFPRQEYWSELPFPLQGIFSTQGLNSCLLIFCIGSGFFTTEPPGKPLLKLLSHVRLLATPWTAVHQAPPSMGFSRQEYWSGVPLPSPVLLPKDTLIRLRLYIIKCGSWAIS